MPHDAGFYPLDVAILSGDAALVELVLAQPGIELKTGASEASGFYVADKPTMLSLEFCANKSFNIIAGGTPLHYACRLGNVEVMKLLLTRCSTFEDTDNKGWRPIKYFNTRTDENKAALKEYIVAYNKHLRTKAVFGESTYYYDVALLTSSTDRRLTSFIEFCSPRDGENGPGVFGSVECRVSLIQFTCPNMEIKHRILKKHPKLTAETHPTQGWTLLHLAAMNNSLPCVERLLTIDKTSVNMLDNWEENGLPYLAWYTHPLHLVKACTALHYSCLVGNMGMAEVLLKAGADWTIKDSKDRLAETYVMDAFGDEMLEQFKRLCDEEDARRKGQPVGSGLDKPTPAPPQKQNKPSSAAASSKPSASATTNLVANKNEATSNEGSLPSSSITSTLLTLVYRQENHWKKY